MKFCLSKDIKQELNELNSYRYKIKQMTRAEAIKCFEKHMPEVRNAVRTIDFYIEAGMLKVEGEKTIEEKAIDALREMGVHYPSSVVNKLSSAGFKIVEK